MSNKGKVKNQDTISVEDLHVYLNYVLSGQVKDEKHAKELRRLARRTTTLSDVTVVVRALMQPQDTSIEQLMEILQIQHRVLEKLGATDETFAAAKAEYKEHVEEVRESLKKQAESMEKPQEEK